MKTNNRPNVLIVAGGTSLSEYYHSDVCTRDVLRYANVISAHRLHEGFRQLIVCYPAVVAVEFELFRNNPVLLKRALENALRFTISRKNKTRFLGLVNGKKLVDVVKEAGCHEAINGTLSISNTVVQLLDDLGHIPRRQRLLAAA